MKKIINKILTMILFPAIAVALVIGCSGDDGVTYSMKDVSSRISGLSSTSPGQGATLVVSGSGLDDVVRIFVGDVVVAQQDFVSQEESSLTFIVPPNSNLGENELLLVWPGPDRGFASVNVVKFHTISALFPWAASAGETVTMQGANLDLVDDIDVNGTAVGTIVSQTPGMIRFTMPAGATTGPVSISSAAGSYASTTNLIACDSEPSNLACAAVINTNGSFEDGDVGTVGTISVPGWNLGGSLITSEITTEEFFEGNQSSKITINSIGANPWNIQPTSPMAIELDQEYHLSLMVKGSGLASVKFAIDGDASGGYAEYGGSSTVAVNSSTWTEISYNFTPTSASGNNGTIRFAISMSYSGNVGGVLYMDNLRVVKVE